MVDNPPIKDHGAIMITDLIFLGDEDTSYDGSFIKSNKISHIINAEASKVPSLFDNSKLTIPLNK